MTIRIHELNPRGGALIRALAAARAAEAPRTGLHVSTICDDMHRLMAPKAFGATIPTETRLAFQECGNVFEDALAAQLRSRFGWVKPAPRTHHGIIGSPDGYSPMSRTIDEVKMTWVSERGFLDSLKFQRYLWQSLFYADAFDAIRIRLHVLFVCGDYRPPFPQSRQYTVRFDPSDTNANTQRLIQHATDRRL